MTPRAAIFTAAGRAMGVEERRMPELLAGEILVRVEATTLCRSDLHTFTGRRTERTPCILGHEIVGNVERFGPGPIPSYDDGSPVRVDDRITWSVVVGCGKCRTCQADLPQKCSTVLKYGHVALHEGGEWAGGLATHIILRPRTVVYRVDESIPDGVAAMANCSIATAAAIVRNAGDISGKSVVIFGGGALGATICAMLAEKGASEITVIEPVLELAERALRFGATRAHSPADRLAESAVDVAIEVSGSADAARLAIATPTFGGTAVLAGTVSPTVIDLNAEYVVRRCLTIKGVHNYHPRDLGDALAFLTGPGRAFPFAEFVTGEFSLDDLVVAFAVAQRQVGRRIMIRP